MTTESRLEDEIFYEDEVDKIKVGGSDEFVEVEKVRDYGGGIFMITFEGEEHHIFQDSVSAGIAARKYWRDMAEYDPKEFTCVVGEKSLIAWGLGSLGGPGRTQVDSLNDWLDLWLDALEEH